MPHDAGHHLERGPRRPAEAGALVPAGEGCWVGASDTGRLWVNLTLRCGRVRDSWR